MNLCSRLTDAAPVEYLCLYQSHILLAAGLKDIAAVNNQGISPLRSRKIPGREHAQSRDQHERVDKEWEWELECSEF